MGTLHSSSVKCPYCNRCCSSRFGWFFIGHVNVFRPFIRAQHALTAAACAVASSNHTRCQQSAGHRRLPQRLSLHGTCCTADTSRR